MGLFQPVTATRFPHDTPTYRQQSEMKKAAAQLLALDRPHLQYNTDTSTVDVAIAVAKVSGARDCILNMTGALGAGKALTLPTAAALVAALPGAVVGESYRVRVMNLSSGNYAWTVTTNTGLTLTGTMTVAQNTYRDLIVTLTNVTAGSEAATVQSIGQFTQSAV